MNLCCLRHKVMLLQNTEKLEFTHHKYEVCQYKRY